MTIGELREILPSLYDEDREPIRDLLYMLTPLAGADLMAFQKTWDGKKLPYSQFIAAQNKLLTRIIDTETSPPVAELRKQFGLEPITLATEIIPHVPLDETQPHFRMTQCLCGPNRHCIMAIGYEWPEVKKEEALSQLKAALREMKIDPWCVICRSMAFYFEDAVTRWKTREEAAPHLAQLQIENLLANAHFHQVKNN